MFTSRPMSDEERWCLANDALAMLRHHIDAPGSIGRMGRAIRIIFQLLLKLDDATLREIALGKRIYF